MQVLWTKQARSHLQSVYEYILPENPTAALDQIHRIKNSVDHLSLFPRAGRPGRIAGTRELVIPRTEFIVAYLIRESTIHILAIRHAARQWPHRLPE